MDFKTTLDFKAPNWNISYSNQLFFLGSCFSNNIGEHLSKYKFKTQINPFGIIYNPISIFKVLENVLKQKNYTKEDIFCHNEVWYCFDFHSEISNTNPEKLLVTINTIIKDSFEFLKQTDSLFITFGSAWVYKNSSNEIVANCHKIPQKEFDKTLLTSEYIEEYFSQVFNVLKKINPTIKVVLTLSPVRHIRDGLIENNRSKAVLISAIHKIVTDFKNCYYFPAYELVIDDLRDYRFFKKDLVHPNDLAIEYVIENFESCFFDEKTIQTKKDISKVLKSFNHKVFHKETTHFKKFKANLLRQITELENQGFDFKTERTLIA